MGRDWPVMSPNRRSRSAFPLDSTLTITALERYQMELRLPIFPVVQLLAEIALSHFVGERSLPLVSAQVENVLRYGRSRRHFGNANQHPQLMVVSSLGLCGLTPGKFA